MDRAACGQRPSATSSIARTRLERAWAPRVVWGALGLGLLTGLLFALAAVDVDRLWLAVVKRGMITGEPMGLLGIISPMRFSEVHAAMAGLVEEWVQVGLVVRFASSVGPVLFFKGFLKQQSLKYGRERPSQFPCPPGYMRTTEGLKAASDVPWVEAAEPVPAFSPVDSGKSGTFAGFLPENPDSCPQQQQQQQQQREQQQEQQQQQQQQQDEPGAAAAALEAFGITGRVLVEIAGCPEEDVRGWIAYAETQPRLQNPRGYVIKHLRSREPPPALPAAAAEDAESYEALKRRYVPDGWDLVDGRMVPVVRY